MVISHGDRFRPLKDRAVPLPNGHSWLIHGGDLNQLPCPETNSSHLKVDGRKTTFLLGWSNFRGYVSFREGTSLGMILQVIERSWEV